MSVREGPNGGAPYSVVAMIGANEFEAGPFRDAGSANQAQLDITEQLRLLSLATMDPHLTALLELYSFRGKRPRMERIMMGCAHLMALRSTCVRLQVGCVITDPGMTTIYSVGYNGNYRGGPNACDTTDVGGCGCLHAEDNALVKLKTETSALVLFTTHSPCPACAKRVANQGNITSVYYATEYRDLSCLDIFKDARIASVKLLDD